MWRIQGKREATTQAVACNHPGGGFPVIISSSKAYERVGKLVDLNIRYVEVRKRWRRCPKEERERGRPHRRDRDLYECHRFSVRLSLRSTRLVS